MKHIREFSRFAHVYSDYNIIQKEVASELVGMLGTTPPKIVDLGSGSGTLFKALTWSPKSYMAVDLSREMLKLHPKENHVETVCQSFDEPSLYEMIQENDVDLILSSSSLQWSNNLDRTLSLIKKCNTPFALSLFTNETFKALHETAKTRSPLYSREEISSLVKKHFDLEVVYKRYTLNFKNSHEIFSYLKRSGVSGSNNQLSYRETKTLMREYPLDHLEFDVGFIVHPAA